MVPEWRTKDAKYAKMGIASPSQALRPKRPLPKTTHPFAFFASLRETFSGHAWQGLEPGFDRLAVGF